MIGILRTKLCILNYSEYFFDQIEGSAGFPTKRCTSLIERNILACSTSRIFKENL